MPRFLPVAFLLAISASSTAFAQDDEFDLLDGDEEGGGDDDRPTGEDEFTFDDDEDALDAIDPLDPDAQSGDDLLGGEPLVREGGGDNANIYRETQKEVEGLEADEEVIVWEAYLDKYPESTFAPRIQKRMDELMEGMYDQTVRRPGDTGGGGGSSVLPFSQSLQLENINPRSRVQAGFEIGLPSFFNVYVDYEHAIQDNFSVHGGIRRRYTGWSVEGGARYALLKSERTHSLVTGIMDVRVNTNPAFLGVRPQVAAGKRFKEQVDVQVQAGVDLDLRASSGVNVVGGFNATWLGNDFVGVFVESQTTMKWVPSNDGTSYAFRFNVVSVGMKFYPGGRKDLEANAGFTIPYSSQYWRHHFGTIMGQVNYYQDE